MEEETHSYLRHGLYHLRYARKLALRTGLVEELDEYGWPYGDPTSVGDFYETVLDGQIDALLRMLEGGRLRGEIINSMLFVDDYNEDYEVVVEESLLETKRLPTPARAEQLIAGEGSFVVIVHGERRLLARYRGIISCLDPKMAFFRLRADRNNWGAHFVVLLKDAEFDPLFYTYEFFDKLVGAWEVLHGARRPLARAG